MTKSRYFCNAGLVCTVNNDTLQINDVSYDIGTVQLYIRPPIGYIEYIGCWFYCIVRFC